MWKTNLDQRRCVSPVRVSNVCPHCGPCAGRPEVLPVFCDSNDALSECNAFSCVLHLQSTSVGRGKSYVREMRCESCRWWAHFETVFFIVAVAIIIVAIYVFVVVLNPNHPSNR